MPWARPVSPTPWGSPRAPASTPSTRSPTSEPAEGTELDRAVASAGSHLPASAIVAGTASHPGLVINGAIALALVGGWVLLRGLLRPAAGEDGHDESERRRAAAVVRQHGYDSLDPFAIRDDKAFHFAAGGFLAYRVLRETAVVSGDPVGPPAARPPSWRASSGSPEIAAGTS